jgi:hypothetical protein
VTLLHFIKGNALVFILPNEEPYIDFLRVKRVPISEHIPAPLNEDLQNNLVAEVMAIDFPFGRVSVIECFSSVCYSSVIAIH